MNLALTLGYVVLHPTVHALRARLIASGTAAVLPNVGFAQPTVTTVTLNGTLPRYSQMERLSLYQTPQRKELCKFQAVSLRGSAT